MRVNGIDSGLVDQDLTAVVQPELRAVVVPKVEDDVSLMTVDAALSRLEAERGLGPQSIRMIPVIETPLGVTRCEQVLAAAPARTHTALFGSADFGSAIGVAQSADGLEVIFARSRLVVAARAAGLAAPIDGPWLALDDERGLEEDSARSRRLGFQGRAVLHPGQIGPVSAAYSILTGAELAAARRVVAEFERALERGVAAIKVDGRFVDYPVYRLAAQQVRRYDYSQAGEKGQVR